MRAVIVKKKKSGLSVLFRFWWFRCPLWPHEIAFDLLPLSSLSLYFSFLLLSTKDCFNLLNGDVTLIVCFVLCFAPLSFV